MSSSCEMVRMLLLLAVIVGVSGNRLPEDNKKDPSIPPDQWFDQKLDHFNKDNKNTWKQRYQVITEFYKEGGPVFISIAGKMSIYEKLYKHSAGLHGKKFNAMVFQIESRFYGKSHPTSDISTENLAYLTIEQVLADAANFIEAMNKEHKLPEGTKWIAYGGSLSAWMRLKYPDLVYAAVADSAPLEAKVDFSEFIGRVKDIIHAHKPECVTAIQEGQKKLKELLKTPEGQTIVNEKFKVCNPFCETNQEDARFMLRAMAAVVSGVVLYGEPEGMVKMCDTLLDTSLGDAIDRYAAMSVGIDKGYGNDCSDFTYNAMISDMKKSAWVDDVDDGSRQYFYQSCTQTGFFQTSSHPDDLFLDTVPADSFIKQCTDVFGDNFGKDLVYKSEKRINEEYGGRNCPATRVLYVYAKDDPWTALGKIGNEPADSPVIVMEGSDHEVITYELTKDAAKDVVKTWHEVEDQVGKWCSSN